MNAFLLALYSGFSTVQKTPKSVQEPANPTNCFRAKRTANGWEPLMSLERKIDNPDTRLDNIEVETLDHALDVLQKCRAAIGPASLEFLSLTYTASYQFSRHQFSSAHSIAWATLEGLLNVMWLDLQAQIDVTSSGHTKLNNNLKKLLAGRNHTVSAVSQILSIYQKIDDQTLQTLNNARRKRNDFLHKLTPIETDDAVQAIMLATNLITNIAGIRVTLPLHLSSWL